MQNALVRHVHRVPVRSHRAARPLDELCDAVVSRLGQALLGDFADGQPIGDALDAILVHGLSLSRISGKMPWVTNIHMRLRAHLSENGVKHSLIAMGIAELPIFATPQ